MSDVYFKDPAHLEEAKAILALNLTREEMRTKTKTLDPHVVAVLYRLTIAKYFDGSEGVFKRFSSPSGRYLVVVMKAVTGEDTWAFTKAHVYDSRKGLQPIATLYRNYHSITPNFVEGHANGHDYLIAGEDYMGQTVIELDTGRRRDVGYKNPGYGFCWASAKYNATWNALKVEGCFWAAPYEARLYDFSDPMDTGWPEISTSVVYEVDEDACFEEMDLYDDGVTAVVYDRAPRSDGDDEDRSLPITSYEAQTRAYYVLKRNGLEFTVEKTWLSEKETANRERLLKQNTEWQAQVQAFKASDPLYHAFIATIEDPLWARARNTTLQYYAVVSEHWLRGWEGDMGAIGAPYDRAYETSIFKDEKWSIDLGWGMFEGGPIKVELRKEGVHHLTKFFPHSVDGMAHAFNWARWILVGGFEPKV